MPSLVHLFALCAQLSFISLHASALPTKRDGTTAVVHWSSASGTPQHYAAGILYGVPDTANQIPDQFYSDIDLQYVRAGGAQVLAPGRGWIWGETEYEVGLRTHAALIALTVEPLRIGPVQLSYRPPAWRGFRVPPTRSLGRGLDAELIGALPGRQR